MSIRVTALFIYVIFFSVYAWRNWFVSLCSLILLMAVIEHPDMPKTIGGIQGLNPWNLLFANVLMAYVVARGRVERRVSLPPAIAAALFGYGVVVVVGFIRLAMDPQELSEVGTGYLVSEYLVNSFKFMIAGMLLFYGCTTRKAGVWALLVTLGLYFFLAVQVIRWIPLRYALGAGDLSRVASKLVTSEIGYNRVTLSMMLSGASWGVICCVPLLRNKFLKVCAFGAAGLILLGQALTAGRTGYVAWVAVGFVLAVLRFRRLLLLLPATACAVLFFLPGVRERMFTGFAHREGAVVIRANDYAMTAGRTEIWPLVIEEICKAPIAGSGREAMSRTGLRDRIWDQFPGEAFAHPHNAYLECLLDNGIIGFLAVMFLFGALMWRATKLFLTKGDTLRTAVGGVALSLAAGLLVGAMGGQTFYARESAVGLWAALGLMLRFSHDGSLTKSETADETKRGDGFLGTLLKDGVL